MKDKTSQLLKEWRIGASLPATFDSQVWRRIEKATPLNVPQLIADWINQLFAKPTIALSYVAVALTIGLGAGQIHASRDLRNTETQLKARYIQVIDPYAKPIAP